MDSNNPFVMSYSTQKSTYVKNFDFGKAVGGSVVVNSFIKFIWHR